MLEEWEIALFGSDLEDQQALVKRARAAAFADGILNWRPDHLFLILWPLSTCSKAIAGS